MRARAISIRDIGTCISLSFDDSTILLNKHLVSLIEIIKGDTVRIEIGQNAVSNIFIKAADVVEPIIRDAAHLRDTIGAMLPAAAGGGDGDCACATLINETNTQLQNVVSGITAANNKADSNAQLVAGMYDNGAALNQLVTVNNTATLQKLDEVKLATVDTSAGLDSIKSAINTNGQSQSQQFTNMLATLNQINATLNGSNDYYKDPLRIDDTAPLVVFKGYSAITNLDPNSSGNPVWAIEKIIRNGDSYTYLWANGSKSMTNIWLNRANINYLPLAAA